MFMTIDLAVFSWILQTVNAEAIKDKGRLDYIRTGAPEQRGTCRTHQPGFALFFLPTSNLPLCFFPTKANFFS